ncbi:MAG: hypothetical protein KDB35_16625 [Acidimicrobiales bacterium]|nr:hypothetical protein [Acidimicrobiales bacterium]MCB1250998.1 hypothetical protein [Acidimicrobiales bacterium]MCB1259926.1 hypothetical protein [Acidimicrobiales bacterium]
MAETEWNEVGERFADLGRRVQRHWEDEPGESAGAQDEVHSALDGLGDALDRLARAITAGVNDPEVHEAAASATAGVINAVSTSLGRLATKVEGRGEPDA